MPVLRPTHRDLLRFGAAGAAGLVVPRARAEVSAADRKFVFVLACGGWDPTRVFADGFDHDIVDMEASASRATTGGLTWVDAPSRPSVRAFFEQYADRTALVEGLLVPSIAHEACFALSLTGSPVDTGSDWPAILGGARFSKYVAPTLVLGGPYFPGAWSSAVVQTGAKGQLTDLLNGGYDSWDGSTGAVPPAGAEQLVDRWVRGRIAAESAGAGSTARRDVLSATATAADQLAGLQGLRHEITFSSISDLGDSVQIAANALHRGLSRVVVLCSPASGDRQWDTHVTNDDLQDFLFEGLFDDLNTLLFLLETLPGEVAPTLLEETTVVVYSEMGRTPWLNAAAGKDHWPFTSAMLVGSGVRGGAMIGGFDDGWYGESIDPETGDVDAGGVPMSCAALGATILALGDVDPGDYVEAAPIPALMA